MAENAQKLVQEKAAEEYRIKHRPDVIKIDGMDLAFAPLDGELDEEQQLLQLEEITELNSNQDKMEKLMRFEH